MILLILCLLSYIALHAFLSGGICSACNELNIKETLFPHVTIVLAVKNEQQQLPTCLDALLRQNYPSEKYGILVVDDHSTDKTREILSRYSRTHQQISWYGEHDNQFISSKKAALKKAISLAQGHLVLLTDADCLPTPDWCLSMVACFDPKTALVAGFSPQRAPEKPFLDRFLYVDAVSAAFVSASSMARQKGITATGRNLAFNRQLFNQAGGYDALPDTLSGDDDFVVQQLTGFKGYKSLYNTSGQAVLPSLGPQSWLALLRQKSRHLSSGIRYPLYVQILYGFGHGIHFLPFFMIFWTPALALFFWVAVTIIDGVVYKRFAARMKHKVPWQNIFLWHIIYPWLYTLSFIHSFLSQRPWKN
ncbi:glycosyltransferase [candidate division KSB1 bacterium]|nr:glycosyltransferase [candidate division KSB1 bacterium]